MLYNVSEGLLIHVFWVFFTCSQQIEAISSFFSSKAHWNETGTVLNDCDSPGEVNDCLWTYHQLTVLILSSIYTLAYPSVLLPKAVWLYSMKNGKD